MILFTMYHSTFQSSWLKMLPNNITSHNNQIYGQFPVPVWTPCMISMKIASCIATNSIGSFLCRYFCIKTIIFSVYFGDPFKNIGYVESVKEILKFWMSIFDTFVHLIKSFIITKKIVIIFSLDEMFLKMIRCQKSRHLCFL